MGKKRDPYRVNLEKDRQVPVEEIHDDPVVALMKELGTPMTRENYLELAYLKKNPVLSAEEEAELPEQFPTARLMATGITTSSNQRHRSVPILTTGSA
jgi:hypothetical protein